MKAMSNIGGDVPSPHPARSAANGIADAAAEAVTFIEKLLRACVLGVNGKFTCAKKFVSIIHWF